ncbi:MAG: sigma-54-dependent Fis family transcriptional regulator [Deltaproteobacteria bacterium]|nr:sigma-54-dependent Fis family transcriptional regulator [Deltaproteobacteria bacterium]
MGSILIVDDEAEMRLAIKEALTRKGYSVELAPDGREAMRKIGEAPFDMVISDLKMPGMGGMELLKSIKKTAPHTPVLLITAFGTIQKAVEAVKEGAVDFILKPFTLDALESTVEKALMLREGPRQDDARGKTMVSSDPSMKRVISMALTAAASDATVLISGESGTGKELFARLIHANSPRADRPFVPVNCASIPDGLLESELFGHEKGAFTGAIAARQGKFEQADTGTILLDEISEMDIRLQAKLLRIIQEKEVERLGGKSPIPLDIRIIATTNREMKKEVAAGRFREDLFYRLNIFPLLLPPLRERGGDIVHIADHFLNKFAAKYSRRVEVISDEALDLIKRNRWRGNIREMENTIERAVLVSQGKTLELEHLLMGQDDAELDIIEKDEAACTGPAPGKASNDKTNNENANNMTLREMEKGLICKTLDGVEGNRTRAAKVLGISVRTLRNKLKEYGQVLPG